MQDEILELERLHGTPGEWQGIYTLGQKSQARYLTVKSQQRRAMALADRLGQLWRKSAHGKQPPRVAIMGGGLGGLTLASYLAEQSYAAKGGPGTHASAFRWEVHVFERQSQLVPMQRGCAIRKLHPAIHTWPDPKCYDAPQLTKRPTLTDWHAANAGDMAADLVLQVLTNHRVATQAKLVFGILQSAQVAVSLEPSGRAPYKVVGEGQRIDPSKVSVVSDKGPWRADIVIFATGFGVEVPGIGPNQRVSYWRNDDLGQAPLYGQKQRFVISGAGDGGLTDLFRLCLYDFSYDEVMREVLPVQEVTIADAFREAVHRVHPTSVKAAESLQKDLASQYGLLLRNLADAAPADVCDLLDKAWQGKVVGKKKVTGQSLGYLAQAFLRARCKEKVDVLLQVLPEFALQDASGDPLRALVNNPKAMLYNRVLAYLLWRMDAFKILAAPTAEEVIQSEKWEASSATIIARRGAGWKESVLKSLAGALKDEVQPVLAALTEPPAAGSAAVEAYRLGQV